MDKKLNSVSKNMQTATGGLADDAVSEESIQSNSITSDALQIESITADKIAPSVFENASSGIQRVPAPLTSVNYWNSAIYGNITAFTDAYFADKENKNVEATESGILFSPESNSSLVISKAQLFENGIVVLTTDVAHGYETLDYITIRNLGSPFDGQWVISNVPTTTTIVYTINQFSEDSTDVGEDSGAYVVVGGSFGTTSVSETASYKHSIIRKSFVDGVITLTLLDDTDVTSTYQTHGYEVGYTISVIGLGSPYDGVHRITYVPESQNNIVQYRVDNKTVDEFEPKISLTSAFGDGEKITYESSTNHGLSVNQIVEVSGFTTTTGYNLTGRVSGVYGSGSTFTIDSTVVPATNYPETGGTYYCKTAEITVDADAVLFLTGKNPTPTSRNVLVSWSADKPINIYAAIWVSNFPDNIFFTEIDSTKNPNVYDLTGINNYLWNIPQDITHYAIYAEVLAGGEETTLKDFYVFEAVGNADKKLHKVIGASVEPVVDDKNKITIYTDNPHPYSVGDYVILSNMEKVSDSLNDVKYEVLTVSDDKKSFVVEKPTYKLSVNTASGTFLVNTYPTQSISGKVFVAQPFTSSNTTALPNGSATALVPNTTTTNLKTGLIATLTAGSNAVTLTTGNTDGLLVGHSLVKTSGAGAFLSAGNAFVASVNALSTTQFTTTTTHNTSGSITFNSARTDTSFDSFRVSNVSGGTNTVDLTFYVPTTIVDDQTGLVATLTSGSKTVNLTTGNTNSIYVGQFLTKTSGTGAFGNSGLVYITSVNASSTTEFTVDYDHGTSGSTTFKLSSVGKVSLDASVIGGNKQGQITTISSNGLTQKTSEGGDSVNLTDDTNVDNHLSIKDVREEVVASISATGAGTFKTLDADSLSVDTDITIGSENISLVGITNATYTSFIDKKYNGNSYSGSLLDRLARGTIYQAVWLTPTANIPANAQYYGLAAGTFKLDSNRLYQVFVSSSGMRANPDAAAAFEILLSTTPIRVDDSADLSHMARVLNKPIYGFDSINSSGNTSANTASTSLYVSNGYWGDLQGHFYAISPTPVATNTTTFTITNWQRHSNGNATITVDNNSTTITRTSNAGKYIQSTINANSHMFIGVSISNTTYGPHINGTYEVSKLSRNTFLIDTTNTTAVALQSNNTSLGTITLVDPIMTNTKATFSGAYLTGITGTATAGSTTINAISSTANIFAGDTIYRTAGATLVNTTVVSVTNSTAIVVANSAGSSGSITFSTNLTVATSDGTNHTYVLENLFQSGQLVDVDSSNASWDITGGTIVSANATQFTITPTGTPQANGNTNTAATTATWSDRQVQLHRNYLPSETDLYYVVRLRHGVSTFDEYKITVSENPNNMLAVTDLGQAKQMTFVAQQGNSATPWTSGLPIGYTNTAANASSSSTNTVTVTETQTVYASDSAYYDNYGKGSGTSIPYAYQYYLYQGNPGTASGIKKSAVLFPAFVFTGKTDGLTITKLEVYLRNRHSYNSSGLTAYIGAFSGALGSSVPLALNACVATTTTFTKGQGKWVQLPPSWYSTFKNSGSGIIGGILLGVTDENPDTYYDGISNYGYFDGVTLNEAPQLRVTFKYNASVSGNNSSGGGGGGGDYIAI